MAKRGRPSAADLAARKAALDAAREQGLDTSDLCKGHQPPPELSKAETKIWRKIVNDFPPDWFSEGDIPLLVAYCQQFALLHRIQEQAESEPLIVTNPKTGAPMQNPIFAMQSRTSASLSMLSTKLRLSQSTRLTAGNAATKKRNHSAGNVADKKPWEM
jgi:P27 family predicted phage terminase small subunit